MEFAALNSQLAGLLEEGEHHPLPKIDPIIPNENSDRYRGVNVTSVIARTFEKVVYHTHDKAVIEKNLK